MEANPISTFNEMVINSIIKTLYVFDSSPIRNEDGSAGTEFKCSLNGYMGTGTGKTKQAAKLEAVKNYFELERIKKI